MTTTMEEKIAFIWWLALHVNAQGNQMNGLQVAAELNAHGLRTNYGTTFSGGRGTYRLIRSTYHCIERRLGVDMAAIVADTFTKPDGTHAWA